MSGGSRTSGGQIRTQGSSAFVLGNLWRLSLDREQQLIARVSTEDAECQHRNAKPSQIAPSELQHVATSCLPMKILLALLTHHVYNPRQ